MTGLAQALGGAGYEVVYDPIAKAVKGEEDFFISDAMQQFLQGMNYRRRKKGQTVPAYRSRIRAEEEAYEDLDKSLLDDASYILKEIKDWVLRNTYRGVPEKHKKEFEGEN